ncbi:MAG: thioredoxin family protein, partial [Duncaniella sp.]|nr:thioredoxin family protein [Duncaniella sp.]
NTSSADAADRTDNAVNRAAEKIEAAQAEVAVVESLTNGTIAPHATLPTVIDFNATWCPPCQKFAPIFHEVAEEMKGKALFMSVDVDKNAAVARQFGVQSIPQISILYPDGTVRSTVGFMPKEEFLKFLAL